MSGTGLAAPAEREWKRQFASDVFHALAQPLTALHCMLELALRQTDTEQQRAALRDGLKLASETLATAKFVRKLAEADDPGNPVVVPLAWSVKCVVEEMKPVSESVGTQIRYSADYQLRAQVDPAHLHDILLHIIDSSLQCSGGRDVQIDFQQSGDFAELVIGPEKSDGSSVRIEAGDVSRNVAIAERMARASGGSLEMYRLEHGLHFRLQLPMPR